MNRISSNMPGRKRQSSSSDRDAGPPSRRTRSSGRGHSNRGNRGNRRTDRRDDRRNDRSHDRRNDRSPRPSSKFELSKTS